jgi:hypothetical protein
LSGWPRLCKISNRRNRAVEKRADIVNKEEERAFMLKNILLVIIFAFVAGILIYVGGALLQTINFAHIPEPTAALEGLLLGVILGIIFVTIARRQKKRAAG